MYLHDFIQINQLVLFFFLLEFHFQTNIKKKVQTKQWQPCGRWGVGVNLLDVHKFLTYFLIMEIFNTHFLFRLNLRNLRLVLKKVTNQLVSRNTLCVLIFPSLSCSFRKNNSLIVIGVAFFYKCTKCSIRPRLQ